MNRVTEAMVQITKEQQRYKDLKDISDMLQDILADTMGREDLLEPRVLLRCSLNLQAIAVSLLGCGTEYHRG